MTQPRRHIPGQVVNLKRRCFQRKFFFRPDSFITRVLNFETARASRPHGQAVVHGAMAMSTPLSDLDGYHRRARLMYVGFHSTKAEKRSNSYALSSPDSESHPTN